MMLGNLVGLASSLFVFAGLCNVLARRFFLMAGGGLVLAWCGPVRGGTQ